MFIIAIVACNLFVFGLSVLILMEILNGELHLVLLLPAIVWYFYIVGLSGSKWLTGWPPDRVGTPDQIAGRAPLGNPAQDTPEAKSDFTKDPPWVDREWFKR